MSRNTPTAGQWLWLAAGLTVIGYVVIATTVFVNVSTLFEYNGKSSGPAQLSALEAFIIFEFFATAVAAAIFLRKAKLARTPGAIRWWHSLPIVVALSAIVLVLFMMAFATYEIIY